MDDNLEIEINAIKKAWTFCDNHDIRSIISGAKLEDMSFDGYVMYRLKESGISGEEAERITHYVMEHYGL